jgi:hypothetical protein
MPSGHIADLGLDSVVWLENTSVIWQLTLAALPSLQIPRRCLSHCTSVLALSLFLSFMLSPLPKSPLLYLCLSGK